MLAPMLASAEVWKAIEVYLGLAYTGPLPSLIRTKLDALHAFQEEDFYTSPAFEHNTPTAPSKMSIRLGNRFYPHMKLTIECSPDQRGYLFRADTHDTHCCPAPGSRDYVPFCELMEKNQKLAQAIEIAWADQQLPTFKTFLRDDLKRRMAAGKTAG